VIRPNGAHKTVAGNDFTHQTWSPLVVLGMPSHRPGAFVVIGRQQIDPFRHKAENLLLARIHIKVSHRALGVQAVAVPNLPYCGQSQSSTIAKHHKPVQPQLANAQSA
jgi:hypothetical protein